MAIQYSLSYDKQGNPSLVKNTITGSKPVVNTSFNIGELEQARSVQTNFKFAAEMLSKENSTKVYDNLTKYIYEEENQGGQGGKDFDPFKQTEEEKFNKMDFDAAAARDAKGNIIGGSTFTEKAKMSAVEAYINAQHNPVLAKILGAVPFIGSIYKAAVHAGSKYVDPYFDPLHNEYYETGRGQYIDEEKRRYTDDQQIFKVEQAGIDSGTGVEDPSDYLQRINEKQKMKEFAEIQNSIGKALHGDGGGVSTPTPTAPKQTFTRPNIGQISGGGGGGGNRGQGAGAKAGTSGGTGGRRGGAGGFR